MKKQLCVLLCLMLMLALLGGCGDKTQPSADPQPDTPQPVAPEVVYDDTLIGVQYEEEGDFDFGDGSASVAYSFRVPQLLDESATAQKMNAEMMDWADAILTDVHSGMEEGWLEYSYLGWKATWSGSLVSILLECSQSAAPTAVTAFYYDFADGKQLTAPEVLAWGGTDEWSFTEAARRSAMQSFDAAYAEFPCEEEMLRIYYAEILECRYQTLAGIEADTVVPYLDGDTFHMVAKFYTPAGAGWYYDYCTVDTAQPTAPSKTLEATAFTARLTDDNRVMVSFTENEELRALLTDPLALSGVDDLVCGEEYEVQGAYSDYADIFLGSVGQDVAPYLFLVTKEGRLEAVSLLGCARAGVFCPMPLPGIWGVKTLTESLSDSGEYTTVYAETENGARYDLSDWLYLAQHTPPLFVWENSAWWTDTVTHGGSYDSRYCVMLQSEYPCFVLEEDAQSLGITTHEDGYLYCLGMTRDGLVCFYQLDAQEGIGFYGGGIALRYEPLAYDTLYLRCLGGAPLMDLAIGGERAMYYSMG